MTGYEDPEDRRRSASAPFVERADELAAAYGDRFAPTPYLRDLAATGGTFPA